jgi:hypothetical protein
MEASASGSTLTLTSSTREENPVEHSVIFRDNQEAQAADFNNMETWMQASIDHIVFDTVEQSKAYTGLLVTKSGPTTVSVTPGRLYSSGLVYASEETVSIDLYTSLPVTQKKQIAIVCHGNTVSENPEPRDFIIDADTGVSQPQAVSLESTRLLNLGLTVGNEAIIPVIPTVGATDLAVAYVVVDTTGIVSIQQVTANQLANIQNLSDRANIIVTDLANTAAQIATLQTTLSGLAERFKNYTLKTDFQKLVDLVNTIWALIHQATYIYLGTDYFVDTTQSATTANVDGAYNATIADGLRFPGSSTTSISTLSLLNPADPGVRICSDPAGFVIPRPSGQRVRLDCSFPSFVWLEERILQYTFWSFVLRHLHPVRERWRCGPRFLANGDADVWKNQADYDGIYWNLKFDSETWATIANSDTQLHPSSPDWCVYRGDRFQFFWNDFCDQFYWSRNFDNFSHSGNHVAQTFLNAQDGWLSGITVFMFNQLFEPLTCFITMCDEDGAPNLTHGIRRVVLDDVTIQASFGSAELVGDIVINEPNNQIIIPTFIFPLRINFDPVFLEAGKRYAIHFLTINDHQFCISDRYECFQVHQGHWWVSSANGLYIWPGSPKSLRFKLWYATWGQWQGQTTNLGGVVRQEVQLSPLTYSSGIEDVDVLADSLVPHGTDLSIYGQIGGIWKKFDSDPNTPQFAGNVTLLPMKMVFTGTTDLMPAISMVQSQVTVHSLRASTFHYISNQIPWGSGATMNHVKAVARMKSFVSAHQTLTAYVNYGTLPGTQRVADTVTDVTDDDGTISRTFVWNLPSAQSTCYIELNGTQDGTGNPFVVSQLQKYGST